MAPVEGNQMRRLTLILLVLMAGCIPSQPESWPIGRDGGDRELPRNRPAASESRPAQKVVNAKQEPATLIAADRTSCQVTSQRFKETIVGTKVWCLWR